MESAGDVLDEIRGRSDDLYEYFFRLSEDQRCVVLQNVFASIFGRHPYAQQLFAGLAAELVDPAFGAEESERAYTAAERDVVLLAYLCFVLPVREAYVKTARIVWTAEFGAETANRDGAAIRAQLLSRHVMPAISRLIYGTDPASEPQLLSTMRSLRAEHAAWSSVVRI